MKNSKRCAAALGLREVVREPEPQQEVDNFLQALTSYPAYFATDPKLSFEQYLGRFSSVGRLSASNEDRLRN